MTDTLIIVTFFLFTTVLCISSVQRERRFRFLADPKTHTVDFPVSIDDHDPRPSMDLLRFKTWCKANCNGRWDITHGRAFFARVDDAVHFKMAFG